MKKIKIKSIKYEKKTSEMYDFTVESNHNYFVENILSHNSEHTNMMFVDEIDVVQNSQAYEEAKLIPGYSKGLHPVTVKLSTRKFAFGLMQKEIDLAPVSGDKILRWNLLDVTQKCPDKKHKPEEPREDRYVAKSLPPKQMSVEDFMELPDVEKDKYELVKNAYAGCKTCSLLPVCKTRLAERPKNESGGLFKPVGAVVNTFKKTNPDMAEAQLMCWKPSTKGMVYPRFESTINTGNVITLEKAWEILIGDPPLKKFISEADLLWKMHDLGIQFYAGVDWGYTHDFVIVIFAIIPNGEVWVIDCYSVPGLEFSDILEISKTYRDKYRVTKWFCDQAMPANIKSFNRNQMKSPSFTKDVMGGIESLRSKIIDGSGRRLLKIINTENNKKIITAFQKHHFKLDTAGNPTTIPDDTPGVADQADAMRYVGQNLFPVKGTQKPGMTTSNGHNNQVQDQSANHTDQMKEEILKRISGGEFKGGSGKKGGFFFNF